MSIHLYEATHPSRAESRQLRVLAAYEDGSVTLYGYTRDDKTTSVEGIGWDKVWETKLHVESGKLPVVDCCMGTGLLLYSHGYVCLE
jgi:ASTRA-associated protein 1